LLRMSRDGVISPAWMANLLDDKEWRFRRMETLLKLQPSILVGRGVAWGERVMLERIANVIDLKPSEPPSFPPHELSGKVVQLGYPAPGGGIIAWSEPWFEIMNEGEQLGSLLPLPFRDQSIDGIVMGELAEHEVVSEAHRVLKKGGKILGMTRDPSHGGVDPVLLSSILSWRFNVIRAEVREGVWLVHAVKLK